MLMPGRTGLDSEAHVSPTDNGYLPDECFQGIINLSHIGAIFCVLSLLYLILLAPPTTSSQIQGPMH